MCVAWQSCCAMLSAQYVRFDASHGPISLLGHHRRTECHCSRLPIRARDTLFHTVTISYHLPFMGRRAVAEEAFATPTISPRKDFEGVMSCTVALLGSCSPVQRRLATHFGKHPLLTQLLYFVHLRVYTCRCILLRRVIDLALWWNGTE